MEQNLSFIKWFINIKDSIVTKIIAVTSAIGGILIFINTWTGFIKAALSIDEVWVKISPDIFNIVFISSILLLHDKIRIGDKSSINRLNYLRANHKNVSLDNKEIILLKRFAHSTLKEFNMFWKLNWFSLLGLYFFRLIDFFIKESEFYMNFSERTREAIKVILDSIQLFFNNLGTFAFTLCFLVLAQTSVKYKNDDYFSVQRKWGVILLFIIPILFCTISYGTIYNKSYHNMKNLSLIFQAISGIFACVSMSMLFARLDSKFINVKSHFIFLLYFYAALQPFYAIFHMSSEDMPIYEPIIISLGLIFKIYLFFIITWIMESGRLFDYFLLFPIASKIIVDAWEKTENNPSS